MANNEFQGFGFKRLYATVDITVLVKDITSHNVYHPDISMIAPRTAPQDSIVQFIVVDTGTLSIVVSPGAGH